ncbi:RNA recognition motif, partial [Trifolium medium]|nr:RNA recognition motif [Trifolium medium]
RESVEREAVGWSGNSRAPNGKRSDYFHHLDKVTTSFFITNFPEDATSEDLWRCFLKFGRVGEVYIPKKLDKRGRRFGFVKFKEVKEVESLSESLRDVWMGNFKLRVNRSRFSRSEKKEVQPPKTPLRESVTELVEIKSGRSFKTALLGSGDGGSAVGEKMRIKAPVNESLHSELKSSVVGTLAREKDVRRIQTTLFMEGYKSIYVTNMGGNMALLRSPVAGDVEKLLRSKNECLEYYFSELKPWVPELVVVQRE